MSNSDILNGYRLEDEIFNKREQEIDLFSKKIYNSNKSKEDYTSIVNDIKSEGISICHINDFNNLEIQQKFKNIQKYYYKFQNNPNIQERIKNYQNNSYSLNNGKPFELNSSHYLGRNLDLGDGVIEFFLSDVILNIASAYLKSCPKAFQFNSWIHMPYLKEGKRISSMNWHRDPEAIRIFKVFLVINGITNTTGPFQYIKGSHIDGKYSNLQEYRISNRYPGNDFIKNKVNPNDIVSLIGPAGTIAFVDNFGFHRGGYVESGMRLLTQAVFLKPNVIQLPIWKNQRVSFNQNHESYKDLSPMAKYVINNEF